MKILIITSFLFLNSFSYGQIKATTDDGKKVLLNKNGTWKYVPEKKDTTSSSNLKVTFTKENTKSSDDIITYSNPDPNADCAKYVSVGEDKFTGKKTISGKSYIIIPSKDNSKDGIKIINMVIGENSGVVLCNITAIGKIGCVDRGDKVYFICVDGTRFNMGHASDFNCQGDFTLYFGNPFGHMEELSYLSTKKVTSIRVEGRNSIQDVDLSNEQSNRLMNEISCLAKYQK